MSLNSWNWNFLLNKQYVHFFFSILWRNLIGHFSRYAERENIKKGKKEKRKKKHIYK